MTADFEALVRAHQAAVCAMAYSVLRDRGRSEDIAQDAFLIAWQKLPELPPPPPPLPAWICGIARNLARNAARKRREAPMSDHTTEPVAATTPLDRALSNEHLDLANRALATLGDDDREVVVLYYRGDESISEVAAALGIPDATARKRLQRTRERLRSALASVEAALRATRPGPAFTVACIAALAAGRVPDAAAAAAPATPIVPIALGAAALALVGILGIRAVATSGSSAAAPVAPPAAAAPSGSATPATATAAHPDAIAPQPSRARTAGFLDRITAAERAALLARVRAARGTDDKAKVYDFSDTKVGDFTQSDEIPTGPLRKASLRYAIKLFHPLLLACRTSDKQHGRLAVKMRLTGEAASTVVESVEITGDPPLSEDVEFVECVRTTLETVELPSRDDSVPWDVYYPLVF